MVFEGKDGVCDMMIGGEFAGEDGLKGVNPE